MAYNILILGAAYGSLLASKMLFGGHKIHHVCLPAEADLINAEGFRVRLPVKGRMTRWCSIDEAARQGDGRPRHRHQPEGLRPDRPCHAGAAVPPPGVRELLDAVAKSRVPCMSIMNMPPLPYVKRIPGPTTPRSSPPHRRALGTVSIRAV